MNALFSNGIDGFLLAALGWLKLRYRRSARCWCLLYRWQLAAMLGVKLGWLNDYRVMTSDTVRLFCFKLHEDQRKYLNDRQIDELCQGSH